MQSIQGKETADDEADKTKLPKRRAGMAVWRSGSVRTHSSRARSREHPSVNMLRIRITETQRKNRVKKQVSWEIVKPLRSSKPSQHLPTIHTTFVRKEQEKVDQKRNTDENKEVIWLSTITFTALGCCSSYKRSPKYVLHRECCTEE